MKNYDIALLIIFSTLIILLLIAGIVIAISIGYRKAQAEKIRRAQMEAEYLKELRTIQSETQEATLTHIAAELHDNIGQLLTLTRLHLEKEQLIHPEAAPIFAPISQALQDATKQVRLLSHSLSSHFIADHGLLHTFTQEIQRLESLQKCAIAFSSDQAEPALTVDQQMIIFRMTQEILSNSLRHSGATSILINLKTDPFFSLTIADNGIGFDYEAAIRNSSGLGLGNIERRATMAGMKCNVATSPNNGCAYTIAPDTKAVA